MHPFTFTALAAAFCVLAAPSLHAADPPSPSKLSLDPKDENTISLEGEMAIINIRSPRGIGRTSLRAADGIWPKYVLLRLHLKGLEHFEISNGSHALATSVGSTEEAAARLTHVTPGAGAARLEIENQVPADHPLSLSIRPVPSEGAKPKIPLEGYFEVELPEEFLKPKPPEVNIRWIDFYR